MQEPKQKIKAEAPKVIVPKVPHVPGTKRAAPPKPVVPKAGEPKKITYIYFTDDKNHKITQASYNGMMIRAHFGSTGLIDHKVKIKAYDHEVMGENHFLGEVGNYTISANACHVDIVLTKQMQDKGGNFWYDEVYVKIEIIATKALVVSTQQIEVKHNDFKVDVPDNETKGKIGEVKKEKFDKVKEKAEEAVIHISSEIATAIEIDKNGKIVSYPDYGGYNGQDEYKEKDDIYCKKISASRSAFPTFKAYIYRGNTKGEAVKKLKQDLKFKTHENAEATILEVSRHTLSNNKNYGSSGPVPPNTINKLHGLRYKSGTNSKGKQSFRYRIVDSIISNFPITKDYTKDFDTGSMNLGSRSSISIDPWNSAGLIGCVGIRGNNGDNHPSTKDTFSKQDKVNYKFIYHSVNNYLEGVIPELTGIFGRRGFSTSEGAITVAASTYDHEVKVFVLVDPLPEINNCNCIELKPPVEIRKNFYESFGTKTIDYIDKKSTANKFKGLYMIAQKRKETGFLLTNLGKNPMNIKGSGDLGQTSIDTHETIKGKYVTVPGEKFANFSTEDKGFQGYLDLLESNYSDAYKSLFDDSKTIDDFTAGLEDTGKLGAYATGKAQGGLSGTDDYKLKVKDLFDGIKKDYLKIYECKLCKEKDAEKKKKIQEDVDLIKKLK